MLNLFRHHIRECASHGKETGRNCPRKPACPVYFEEMDGEGMDGTGRKGEPQPLLDPRTGGEIRHWATACEVARDLEARTEVPAGLDQTTIKAAREHFLLQKEKQSRGHYRSFQQILGLLEDFLSAEPRNYRWMNEVQLEDLTAFCSTWTRCNSSKTHDLAKVSSFLVYCFQANFTSRHLGEDLSHVLRWPHKSVSREPFAAGELELVWKAVPALADQYPRVGERIAKSTEVLAYLMRYTGMDLSTVVKLPKASVRANQILSYRTKTGAEVWSAVPEWVIQKLWAAPHESEKYFFWNGNSTLVSASHIWFTRLRTLLNVAGLPHRTPHNFRHYFAIEHLLAGTRIEDISRLLGHPDIRITLRFYARWIRQRQEQLEEQQRKIWEQDPLCRWMDNRSNGKAPPG